MSHAHNAPMSEASLIAAKESVSVSAKSSKTVVWYSDTCRSLAP